MRGIFVADAKLVLECEHLGMQDEQFTLSQTLHQLDELNELNKSEARKTIPDQAGTGFLEHHPY